MKKNQDPNEPNRSGAKEDQDLPGYPHYPPDEDIMNPQHGFKKIAADDELANSGRISGMNLNQKNNRNDLSESPSEEDEIKMVEGTEADVTSEDLLILGDKETDQDLGEDELTGNARVDELEEEPELDVPGSGMNDEEALGQDDEENDYYSLGGDRHENLEEDPNAND